MSGYGSANALLAKRTSTEKWEICDEDSIASYDEFGIATEAVDATAAEVLTDIFVEGEFCENAVMFPYGDTPADWREILAPRGIYLRKSISAAGI